MKKYILILLIALLGIIHATPVTLSPSGTNYKVGNDAIFEITITPDMTFDDDDLPCIVEEDVLMGEFECFINGSMPMHKYVGTDDNLHCVSTWPFPGKTAITVKQDGTVIKTYQVTSDTGVIAPSKVKIIAPDTLMDIQYIDLRFELFDIFDQPVPISVQDHDLQSKINITFDGHPLTLPMFSYPGGNVMVDRLNPYKAGTFLIKVQVKNENGVFVTGATKYITLTPMEADAAHSTFTFSSFRHLVPARIKLVQAKDNRDSPVTYTGKATIELDAEDVGTMYTYAGLTQDSSGYYTSGAPMLTFPLNLRRWRACIKFDNGNSNRQCSPYYLV